MAGSQRIEVHAEDLGNLYAEEVASRKGMRNESRKVLILGIAFAVVVVCVMLLPTYMFQNSIYGGYSLALFLEQVSENFGAFVGIFTGNPGLFETHFMQVLICAVSGAALGLCGSTYQGAFNNPLAAPKTLGIMGGGALGALIYILFLQQYEPTMAWNGTATASDIRDFYDSLSIGDWILVNYGQCLCSIVGCFVIVGLVMLISSFIGKGRLSNIVVILAGQVFSVAITAIIQFARYYYSLSGGEDMADQLAAIENYTMVSTYYYHDLLIIVLPILICIIAVLLLRRRLTLLSFGDEEAYSMGVNVNRTRYIMIGLCTLMVALAISFCGHVAYLGFISAHISRKLVGPDFRYLLPASVFVGGGFLCIIQWICNSGLPFTSTYSAGVVCSIVGALVFLVLALKRAREGGSDWR